MSISLEIKAQNYLCKPLKPMSIDDKIKKMPLIKKSNISF
jgi:hypothetical protein